MIIADKVLKVILINIIYIALLSFLLFSVLTPGDILSYRIAALAGIAVFNIFLFKYLPNISVKITGIKLSNVEKIIFAASVLPFIFVLILKIRLEPYGMWDAWAMWNLKSKDIAFDFIGGQNFNIFRPEWHHPGYSVMLPLFYAFFIVNFGFFSEQIVFFINSLLFFAFILMIYVLYGLIRTEKKYKMYLFLSMLYFLNFHFLNQTLELCADFMLSVFFSFMFYIYYQIKYKYIKNINLIYFLLFLFLGTLPLLKNEGMILAVVFFAVFSFENKNDLLKKSTLVLYAVIGFLIPFSFFTLYKVIAPELSPMTLTFDQLFNNLLDISRYKVLILGLMYFHIVVLFAFVPFVIFMFRKYLKHSLAFVILILIHGIYTGIFLITTENQMWHIATAYERIHLQLMPAFLLVSLGSLGCNNKA